MSNLAQQTTDLATSQQSAPQVQQTKGDANILLTLNELKQKRDRAERECTRLFNLYENYVKNTPADKLDTKEVERFYNEWQDAIKKFEKADKKFDTLFKKATITNGYNVWEDKKTGKICGYVALDNSPIEYVVSYSTSITNFNSTDKFYQHVYNPINGKITTTPINKNDAIPFQIKMKQPIYKPNQEKKFKLIAERARKGEPVDNKEWKDIQVYWLNRDNDKDQNYNNLITDVYNLRFRWNFERGMLNSELFDIRNSNNFRKSKNSDSIITQGFFNPTTLDNTNASKSYYMSRNDFCWSLNYKDITNLDTKRYEQQSIQNIVLNLFQPSLQYNLGSDIFAAIDTIAGEASKAFLDLIGFGDIAKRITNFTAGKLAEKQYNESLNEYSEKPNTLYEAINYKDKSNFMYYVERLFSKGRWLNTFLLPFISDGKVNDDYLRETTKSANWYIGGLTDKSGLNSMSKVILHDRISLSFPTAPTFTLDEPQEATYGDIKVDFYLINRDDFYLDKNFQFMQALFAGTQWVTMLMGVVAATNVYQVLVPGRFRILWAGLESLFEAIGKLRTNEHMYAMHGKTIKMILSDTLWPEAWHVSLTIKPLVPWNFNTHMAYYLNGHGVNEIKRLYTNIAEGSILDHTKEGLMMSKSVVDTEYNKIHDELDARWNNRTETMFFSTAKEDLEKLDRLTEVINVQKQVLIEQNMDPEQVDTIFKERMDWIAKTRAAITYSIGEQKRLRLETQSKKQTMEFLREQAKAVVPETQQSKIEKDDVSDAILRRIMNNNGLVIPGYTPQQLFQSNSRMSLSVTNNEADKKLMQTLQNDKENFTESNTSFGKVFINKNTKLQYVFRTDTTGNVEYVDTFVETENGYVGILTGIQAKLNIENAVKADITKKEDQLNEEVEQARQKWNDLQKGWKSTVWTEFGIIDTQAEAKKVQNGGNAGNSTAYAPETALQIAKDLNLNIEHKDVKNWIGEIQAFYMMANPEHWDDNERAHLHVLKHNLTTEMSRIITDFNTAGRASKWNQDKINNVRNNKVSPLMQEIRDSLLKVIEQRWNEIQGK